MSIKHKGKFVILGQGRSGSTLLVDLLNCHPEVTCDHEIFRSGLWRSSWRALTLILLREFPSLYYNYRRLSAQNKVYGFKLFNYQVNDLNGTIKKLYETGWKILWIHREDIVEQSLSFMLGSMTQKWHRRNREELPLHQYHIDLLELASLMYNIKLRNERIQESLAGIEYYKIQYESDLMNSDQWQKTADSLFEHLHLESCRVRSTSLKVDPRPWEEKIANYDQVASATQVLGIKKNTSIGS